MTDKNKRSLIAFLPIAVLVAVLAADIAIFGADSILGASQVALMLAGGVCIGHSHPPFDWRHFGHLDGQRRGSGLYLLWP